MANNYTLFSEVIPQLTEDEAHWCQSRLDHLQALFGDELTEDGEDSTHPKLPEDNAYDPDNTCMFEWAVHIENDEPWGRHLWLHADEGFDSETVATFVQEFLKRFRPQSCFAFTWSETCGKPRVGEFGGGAAFVTAEDIQFVHTHEWVHERTAAFQALHGEMSDRPSR